MQRSFADPPLLTQDGYLETLTFRKPVAQKESEILEEHLMPDHVHMMIAIPPEYAVSQVIGFIKGKRDSSGAGVWGAQAHLRWAALLGPRVLCLDGRS
jgi:REP element-mobilizing transposase RayT